MFIQQHSLFHPATYTDVGHWRLILGWQMTSDLMAILFVPLINVITRLFSSVVFRLWDETPASIQTESPLDPIKQKMPLTPVYENAFLGWAQTISSSR